MNTIILCTLIGIVLLSIEALVLLYREIKYLRALMAGIEQNLNHIWERIHKLEKGTKTK